MVQASPCRDMGVLLGYMKARDDDIWIELTLSTLSGCGIEVRLSHHAQELNCVDALAPDLKPGRHHVIGQRLPLDRS